MATKNTEELTPEQVAKAEGRAAKAEERAVEKAPAQVEKKTGEPVWVNRVMADHEAPAPRMAPGMLRIRIHGGTYERDCTEEEWTNVFSKQAGKWEIKHTGLVAVGHSDPEAIA